MHKLNKNIVIEAPNVKEWVKYELNWQPNHDYTVLINDQIVYRGLIVDDFIDNYEEEFMDDPSASKPESWIDSPYIMPADVAELLKVTEEFIDDPIEENDKYNSDWKPTQILNPEYKKLEAQIEKNPLYKGRWEPPKVRNPHYIAHNFMGEIKEDITALGVFVKTQSQGILVDDIYLTAE